MISPEDGAPIREALGLLNSMVECGEKHSKQSRETVSRARARLEELTQNACPKRFSLTDGTGRWVADLHCILSYGHKTPCVAADLKTQAIHVGRGEVPSC